MRIVPESIHAVLLAVAARHHLPTEPRVVARALEGLSRDYNAEGKTGTGRELLAARLAFSLVRDVPKAMVAVRELVATGRLALPPGRPLRLLDVGAGLGATTLGVALALARSSPRDGAIEATLVDADGSALAVARDVVEAWPMPGGPTLRARSVVARAPLAPNDARLGAGPWDAIVLGQVLSELDGELEPLARAATQAAWLAELAAGLEPSGSLIVVEPALRERTRHLHHVRDAIARTHRACTIFAPCLHQAPCPMLARESDWCHEDRPIDLPAFAEPLARAAGLRWQGLTFSYLVLRRDGATLASALGQRDLHRLVESPRVTKGKRELALCDGPALTRVVRLDRDRSKASPLERAARGDVITLACPPGATGTRIDRETCAAATLPVDALVTWP